MDPFKGHEGGIPGRDARALHDALMNDIDCALDCKFGDRPLAGWKIDAKKCFYCVDNSQATYAMDVMGAPPQWTRILHEFYSNLVEWADSGGCTARDGIYPRDLS